MGSRMETGRGPRRPACIEEKSGSSSVWQLTDLRVWGAGAGGIGPCMPSSCSTPLALWSLREPWGRAGGPRTQGAAGGEELMAEESFRCWSNGTGGEGGARTETVLLRGMGEPGGKTTWGEERRERDEDYRGKPAQRAGHRRARRAFPLQHQEWASLTRPQDAPPHIHLPLSQGRFGTPAILAQPQHLLATFSTSCPPARLPHGCTVMTTPSVSQSSAEAPTASSSSGWMPSRPCSSAMSRSWDGVLLRVAGSSRRRGEGSRDMGCAWPVSRLLLITDRI